PPRRVGGVRLLRLVWRGARAPPGAGGAPPAGPPPPASLIGTSWVAEEIDGHAVIERAESTLSFDTVDRISGQTACNRYFGGIQLGDGTIRVKSTGSTRMACAPEVMEQESRFLDGLATARAFPAEDGKLLLRGEARRLPVKLDP